MPLKKSQANWIFAAMISAAGLMVWLLFWERQPESIADAPFPREWAALIGQISPSFKPGSTTLAEGESLSRGHCQTCHLRPDPSVLPRRSWLEVLTHHIVIVSDRKVVDPAHLALPEKSLRNHRIPIGDLATVMYYYLGRAPESLRAGKRQQAPWGPKDASFHIAHAEIFDPANPAMYSLASVLRAGERIVLGEVVEKTLVVLEPSGKERLRIELPGVATGIQERNDSLLITLIGPQPYTTDDALGKVLRLPTGVLDSAAEIAPTFLLSNLRRPVHTTSADLDGDGDDELLVEEFGFSDGSLGYYKASPGGTFEYHTLIGLSGALSAYVSDFNRDGLPDILGLISQATEGVFMLWGRGGGSFEQELLVQNQPAFGANQLLTADMNGDQQTDLILINGDRMDLPSSPMGPYSGIHVYANDGNNHFNEKFFYPLVGAVQAVTGDFDKDGDFDIVAVSATPDFSRRPLDTAVYLENQGGLAFVPRRIPGTDRGCWSVVAAGDLNRDGYDDLVLGGAYVPIFSSEIKSAFSSAPPYALLILTNETRPRDEKPAH